MFNELPTDINSLTLIQGSDSGNKTVKFSHFLKFSDLTSLDIQGLQLKKQDNLNTLICVIDTTLPLLKYVNFERVQLIHSNDRFVMKEGAFESEPTLNLQKGYSHPLSFVKEKNSEILPYEKYVKTLKNYFPLFKDFHGLTLIRIVDCDLNQIYWEMFDGLFNLKYLILEKNNLKLIPDFAFYGSRNLRSLSLAWNNLLNIQIANLAGLLELEYLDLSHNNFSQLSELSLPPFPKLKLANFGHNPISIVHPNTFEVLNTTDSLILGSKETQLSLTTYSFSGLKLLQKLIINNVVITSIKKEVFVGMPNLLELVLTGQISNIEYDAFIEIFNLEKLSMSNCGISGLSVDSFMGLNSLKLLDLSHNNLEYLPFGIFDVLPQLRELYLNDNKFSKLIKGIFMNEHIRLIRLNNNPWHCSCEMSAWKPMIINRIKQKTIKVCDRTNDKGASCDLNQIGFINKYVYENKVAPKCKTPKKFENWNIFHVLRTQLICPDFISRLKMHYFNMSGNKTNNHNYITPKEVILKKINNTERTFAKKSPNSQLIIFENSNKTIGESNLNKNELYTQKQNNYSKKFNVKLLKYLNSELEHNNEIRNIDPNNQLNNLWMKTASSLQDNYISNSNFVNSAPKQLRRKRYRKRIQTSNPNRVDISIN